MSTDGRESEEVGEVTDEESESSAGSLEEGESGFEPVVLITGRLFTEGKGNELGAGLLA